MVVRAMRTDPASSIFASDDARWEALKRRDRAAEGNGIALFLACDNLRKGAALNAIQIAELLLERQPAVA